MELYFSTDIEADGPIPGPHSMLSFASAVFDNNGKMLGTFSRNLQLLEGANPDSKTQDFWNKNKEAYEETRKNTIRPNEAMGEYVQWVNSYNSTPVFVGFPVAYDFMFMYWYMIKFVGVSPFSHSAMDIKTMAAIAMKSGFRQAVKRNMPKKWFSGCGKHTHVAEDDAVEQGILFSNIWKDLK